MRAFLAVAVTLLAPEGATALLALAPMVHCRCSHHSYNHGCRWARKPVVRQLVAAAATPQLPASAMPSAAGTSSTSRRGLLSFYASTFTFSTAAAAATFTSFATAAAAADGDGVDELGAVPGATKAVTKLSSDVEETMKLARQEESKQNYKKALLLYSKVAEAVPNYPYGRR